VNAWSDISRSATATAPASGSAPRIRRAQLLAIGAAIPLAVLLAIAAGGSPTSARERAKVPQAGRTGEIATAAAILESLQSQSTDDQSDPRPGSAADPDSVRITGTVGPDLTRSLEVAGVPEKQGREYLAALSTAIRLQDGLSVADRFDLVILRGKDGTLGEVAYAGLDRVGRSDVELMKWTDGRETRWIDADGIDPSAQGMEMPVVGRVSSGFGERFHPILGYRRMHDGVDLAAPYGTPVVAAADGRVVTAGWRGGYGREVKLSSPGGIETIYGHMSRLAVAVGASVQRGQVIGYVGSTGLSTGPHLHYEVHVGGKLVNPLSVKLTASPLKGEELQAFRYRLRGLLMGQGTGA
jgi:murein DD-endopeptidase MepM/ murein hydrolase activator NlpD